MEYLYKKGTSNKVLLLIHGTGGTKEDLLPIATYLDSKAHIIALEGDVDEGGMKRFFKRKAPGVFDVDDLDQRSDKLLLFLDEQANKHQLSRDEFIAIGYSNGANIILSTLYKSQNPFKAMFLHHPMLPYQDRKMNTQMNLKVFVGAGKNDPICPAEMTEQIIDEILLTKADVESFWHHQYHQITNEEIEAAKLFYESKL